LAFADTGRIAGVTGSNPHEREAAAADFWLAQRPPNLQGGWRVGRAGQRRRRRTTGSQISPFKVILCARAKHSSGQVRAVNIFS